MKDLPEKRVAVDEQTFGVTFTLFWERGKHRKSELSRPSSVFPHEFGSLNRGIVYLN
jgi:hypothetical protein